MITDRIGRHEVLLPINCIYNKIRERNKRKTFQEKNSFHFEMRSREQSFGSDNGDGNENIISKFNFSLLYLFRDYWNLFILENAGELSRN